MQYKSHKRVDKRKSLNDPLAYHQMYRIILFALRSMCCAVWLLAFVYTSRNPTTLHQVSLLSCKFDNIP